MNEKASFVIWCGIVVIGIGVGEAGDLSETESTAVPALIEVLKNDEDTGVRSHAVQVLGEIGPKAKAAVPALIEALKEEEDTGVRSHAVQALGKISPQAKEVVSALIEALQDDDAEPVRIIAANTLGAIGPGARAAVPALVETLQEDDNGQVRRIAASALGMIGPEAKAAVPTLIEALKKDEDKDVRSSAASALRNIGPEAEATVLALIEALEDAISSVRSSAALALGESGPEGKAAVPALIEVLKEEEDRDVRGFAVLTLRKIGLEAKAITVPALIEVLKEDEDSGVRGLAVFALTTIGLEAEATVPALMEVLKEDEDSGVRSEAARALAEVGLEAKATIVPVLIEVLKEDKDSGVRSSAARVLGEMGPGAKATTVPALIKTLKGDEDRDVRSSAARALAEIGLEAKATTVPALIEVLKDHEDKGVAVPTYAVEALGVLAEAYQEEMSSLSVSELKEGISRFQTVLRLSSLSEKQKKPLTLTVNALEAEFRSRFPPRGDTRIADTIKYLNDHKWPWVFVAYATFFLWWCGVLIVWPRAILLTNDFLKPVPEVKVKLPVEMTVSLRHLLLVAFFAHRRRVVNVWVSRYIETARDNFNSIPTVEDRKLHVTIPVRIDGELITDFSADTLQQVFRGRQSRCLLIHGEGGVGKTSLACQLGKWAMDDKKSTRLTRHPMLPVLIDEELGELSLVEAARGKLQNLIGEANPISVELFAQLLRKKRVMVIVDHLSEMSEETHRKIRPEKPDFPVAALVVTSRVQEQHLGITTTLQPTRLEGHRVSSFVDAYFAGRDKRHLFDDEDFFDGCRRLTRMVGDREITVLLAKLYVDQLVKAKEAPATVTTPDSIPSLMIRYVDELHAKGTDLDTVRTAKEDAMKVAWECLKHTFHPAAADRDAVLKKLRGDDVRKRIDYLESTLRIVRREVTQHDHIRFILDPLAEYMAGLHVVQTYQGREHLWRGFFKRADEKPSLEAISGFLLAVRDCCLASEVKTPAWVVDKLGERGGLDQKLSDSGSDSGSTLDT